MHVKNLVIKDVEAVLLKNGRRMKSLKYSEIKQINLVNRRRKKWLLEVCIGSVFLVVPILLSIHYGLSFLLKDYSMNITTAFLVISGYAFFVLLGINGLSSLKRRYFIVFNNRNTIEVGEDIIRNWQSLENHFIEKGINPEMIFYLKN
jgi:ABC-type bacteriocin/lantibiotic exporter with double-glycine peptidase domain